jgi:hypothetical protein
MSHTPDARLEALTREVVMTRYLIERAWDPMEDEELAAKGPMSKRILAETDSLSSVVWEHTHTVMDQEGRVLSFCVYSAPDIELLREHAILLGGHSINNIYEIGGDVSPADFD